jgi:hypothetical protein
LQELFLKMALCGFSLRVKNFFFENGSKALFEGELGVYLPPLPRVPKVGERKPIRTEIFDPCEAGLKARRERPRGWAAVGLLEV